MSLADRCVADIELSYLKCNDQRVYEPDIRYSVEHKGDTDIYEMIDTPTSLGRLGFVLLMVFLTSSPFLLFDKKKQADVNSHGIEYASVKECKEISQI